MTITRIQEIDKRRSRVFLEEEFAFVLYKGELRHFRMEEGGILAESDYRVIMEEILPKRAKLRAMNLLQKHTYSVCGLQTKLREGEYPEEIIKKALDYVASYGYTDDRRMAEDYIRIHLGDKSRLRITQDLVRKGISQSVIQEAFDNCMEDGFVPEEEEQIRRLLLKRHYEDSEADHKERAKMLQYLLRKGYKPEHIRRCMKADEDFCDGL